MDKMSMIEKMRNLYDYIESAHNHIKLITEIIQDEKEQKRYSDKKSIFQGKISINSDLTKDMYIIKNMKNSHLKQLKNKSKEY